MMAAPLAHERVHAAHPELSGALCRARNTLGPWVTREPGLITCHACLRKLGHVVAPSTNKPATVHARIYWPSTMDRPRCGIPCSRELSFAATAREVTCGTCRRILRRTRTAARRGEVRV